MDDLDGKRIFDPIKIINRIMVVNMLQKYNHYIIIKCVGFVSSLIFFFFFVILLLIYCIIWLYRHSTVIEFSLSCHDVY